MLIGLTHNCIVYYIPPCHSLAQSKRLLLTASADAVLCAAKTFVGKTISKRGEVLGRHITSMGKIWTIGLEIVLVYV